MNRATTLSPDKVDAHLSVVNRGAQSVKCRTPLVREFFGRTMEDLEACRTDLRLSHVDKEEMNLLLMTFTRLLGQEALFLDRLIARNVISPYTSLEFCSDPQYARKIPRGVTVKTGTKDNPIRFAVFSSWVAPASWLHFILQLIVMNRNKVDTSFLLSTISEETKVGLTNSKQWRYDMAANYVIPLFAPFIRFSDFGNLHSEEIESAPWEFQGRVFDGEKARKLNSGEDASFKFFERNPKRYITMFYIVGSDHQRCESRYDSYGKIRDNIRARRFGFDPQYHKAVIVFVGRPGFYEKVEKIAVPEDLRKVLSIQFLPAPINIAVASRLIREAFLGQHPHQMVMAPHAALNYILDHPHVLAALKQAGQIGS